MTSELNLVRINCNAHLTPISRSWERPALTATVLLQSMQKSEQTRIYQIMRFWDPYRKWASQFDIAKEAQSLREERLPGWLPIKLRFLSQVKEEKWSPVAPCGVIVCYTYIHHSIEFNEEKESHQTSLEESSRSLPPSLYGRIRTPKTDVNEYNLRKFLENP